MSEKRKKALVAYLAALFGVAFLVVSVSLIIQINKQGTADTTAAERVVALQSQVQRLEEEKETLKTQITSLENDILEIQEGTEYLESIAYDATEYINYLEHQLQAYISLSAAQQAMADGDQAALDEALGLLAEYSAYLNPQAEAVYFNILEQNSEE